MDAEEGDSMTTPPLDGTMWVCRRLETDCGDYAMRNGVMMFEQRDGSKPLRYLFSVAELRSMPDVYTEIPPKKVTP